MLKGIAHFSDGAFFGILNISLCRSSIHFKQSGCAAHYLKQGSYLPFVAGFRLKGFKRQEGVSLG